MEWIWEVGKLLVAAGLGFGGGQGAVLLDRRRKKQDELAGLKADWVVLHSQGALFVLKNVGTAQAHNVSIETNGGRIGNNPFPTTLEPGGSAAFTFSRTIHSPQLVIRWQDHNGVRSGPATRLIPAMPRIPTK